MSQSISWSDIDTNKGTAGYLDSTEVKSARSKGIDNVFVGMIQAEYEGTVDIDEIIDKYNKGSFGRIPMYISEDKRQHIEKLYRELVVLQCKYKNLEQEFKDKFGIWSDVKNFLSTLGLAKKNKEYAEYEKRLEKLNLEVVEKKSELSRMVDSYLYRTSHIYGEKSETVVLTLKAPFHYGE